MNVLWRKGAATVRETREEIEDELAYTSVLTVFQTLEKNGHVDHERTGQGRAYRYYPTVDREEVGKEAVRYVFTRIFNASLPRFLGALAEQDEIGEERTEDIRKIRESME